MTKLADDRLGDALRANLRRRKQSGGRRRGGLGDELVITGGRALEGEITISGAKNAALPLMIASLLTSEELHLTGVPDLADISVLQEVLRALGGADRRENGGLVLLAGGGGQAPADLVSQMRAGFWVIGPLLARQGQARLALPGGDAIGARPVDFHLAGLKALGARAHIAGGEIIASAPDGLCGAAIDLPFPSVGATHHLIMAAVCARGRTRISNAALEPEVDSLIACLNRMGGKVARRGRVVEIDGQKSLHGAKFAIPPDRIEAGTYALAVAAAGGEVLLRGAPVAQLAAPLKALREAGAELESRADGLLVKRAAGLSLHPVAITTAPWPGFPTDLQAQFMAACAAAMEGESAALICERIFENRFMHVAELRRMGADIILRGREAEVRGRKLHGALVCASDLRASASLVIAGLAAQGETRISNIWHLDRGFENIETKLAACGAAIARK